MKWILCEDPETRRRWWPQMVKCKWNEEAQVFGHDLGLFVTVQLLEETPAVLSLGKLCSEHGYFYEWVNGQKPHLTTDGRVFTCKTDNSVPLVVPGLSSSSSSSSSSTSKPKDQSNYSGESGTSSDPMITRRDKHAYGKPMLTDPDRHAAGNRLHDKRLNGQGSNARNSWVVAALHRKSRGPGDSCARTYLRKRELRFGRFLQK